MPIARAASPLWKWAFIGTIVTMGVGGLPTVIYAELSDPAPVEEAEERRPRLRMTERVQQGVDLGERMAQALAQTPASAPAAVLIGSDCADCDSAYLRSAFAALEQADAVLGPASDGGYVLIGLRRLDPGLFADLPCRGDIDRPDDLAGFPELRAAARGVNLGRILRLRDCESIPVGWVERSETHRLESPKSLIAGFRCALPSLRIGCETDMGEFLHSLLSVGHAFAPASGEVLFQDREASTTLLFGERRLSSALIAERSKALSARSWASPSRAPRPVWKAPGSCSAKKTGTAKQVPPRAPAPEMDAASYHAWYETPRGAWIGRTELRLLLDLVRPEIGASLLDMGCGTGWFSAAFAASGLAVTGLDPDIQALGLPSYGGSPEGGSGSACCTVAASCI